MAEDNLQRPPIFAGHSHVFIVRIWLEPREIMGAAVEWRGVIEHVPTQKRRYLTDLAALTPFITPYLESMGVKDGVHGRLRRLMNRWKQYRKA
jgi:hypothetical protein